MERLNATLHAHRARPIDELPEACLEAGELLLQQLLASGSTSRASAVDLLTVDALVTYAFEVATTVPSSFLERASAAMRRIASVPSPDVSPA
jgi:hypothetical protein